MAVWRKFRSIKVAEPVIPVDLAQNLELLEVDDCDYSGGNSHLQVVIEGGMGPHSSLTGVLAIME